MPKDKRKQQRKKGRKTEETIEEDIEVQSVASQSSAGTRNGSDDQDFESADEVEETEDFESVLAENIDGVTQKSSKGRQSSLQAVQKAFSSRVLTEFVLSRKDTILDCLERCLKKGSNEDRAATAPVAVLLCIQLGAGIESEHVFRTLKPHLTSIVNDPTVSPKAKANCASALGMCCFIASEDQKDLSDCLNALQGVFAKGGVLRPTDYSLYCSSLLAWALLLSVSVESLVLEHISRVMDRLNLLLDTVDVNVRITVGEVLALVYELGREYDDQFVGDTNGLNEALKELATDGNKHRAKKDRRQQRSSFRDVLRAIEDGDCPEEVIKFGPEQIELDSWVKRRQYNAFKEVLGTGVNVHLQENELLRDVFELGAPLKSNELVKVSKFERKLYNEASSKARTLVRGRNRDKKSIL